MYPYATVIVEFVANTRTESAYFQCTGGLHYPGAVGPFGYYNCNWMHMHSYGLFAALPLVWHWEHTRDAEVSHRPHHRDFGQDRHAVRAVQRDRGLVGVPPGEGAPPRRP